MAVKKLKDIDFSTIEARILAWVQEHNPGYDPYNSLGTNPTRADTIEFDSTSEFDANQKLHNSVNNNRR